MNKIDLNEVLNVSNVDSFPYESNPPQGEILLEKKNGEVEIIVDTIETFQDLKIQLKRHQNKKVLPFEIFKEEFLDVAELSLEDVVNFANNFLRLEFDMKRLKDFERTNKMDDLTLEVISTFTGCSKNFWLKLQGFFFLP